MRTKTKYKVSAIVPRLSDEDIDPIEQDDTDNVSTSVIEGWLPWEQEDIEDIKRLIAEKMPEKQQQIIEAFLLGQSYTDIGVTEKYWRYHFLKGVEFIRKALKL